MQPGDLSLATLLALVLWGEARGEPDNGLRAVASVIWTRAGGDWRQLERVLTAPKQFSFLNAGTDQALARVVEENAIGWARCKALALEMIEGRFQPEIEANHYHATAVHPAWADSMRRVATIGRHVFYRA
jgi:N-acetylmuramoyl-L-alanine amidase